MEKLDDIEAHMPDEAAIEAMKASIAEYNAERPEIQSKGQIQVAIYLGIFGLIAAFLAYATWGLDRKNTAFSVVACVAIFVGYKIYEFAWSPVTQHLLSLRYDLFPKLFGFIDGLRYEKGRDPSFLGQIRALKLVKYTSAETDDWISGTHQGLDFELSETKLIVGSGKNKETVFSGLMFHFRLDQAFPGTLIAAKRGGWFERAWKEAFRTGPQDELLSDNLRLDETHEFHSDNYGAAMPIIRGVLTSVLIWLSDQWSTNEVRIALSGEDGYLMLPSTGDYFSLPGIDQDVDYRYHVEPLVREMVMLLSVAHVVRKVG